MKIFFNALHLLIGPVFNGAFLVHRLFFRLFVICFLGISVHLFTIADANAQRSQKQDSFSRADSLRGTLTQERSAYDIQYYHLDVKLDIGNRFIKGSNLFQFKAVRDFKRLQFDLFDNFRIEKIHYNNQEIPFQREFNAVFVDFPTGIKKGTIDSFVVFYSGHPRIAERAPWDGGFVFSQDSAGKPWVATANQGLGASSWWPNKDHLSDEVDSMLISVSVPNTLINVSNGRLRKTTPVADGYTRYDWFVSNPINNYSVSLNVADYVHVGDTLHGEKGVLDLDYWVLRENLQQAKPHFKRNVKPMLKAFEYWLGPYPFYEDSYKLVDVPYLGMEHQSAVAYGNKYMNGYLGVDVSGTGWGLKWDFIIIHESAHEWFGNNITAGDLGDMWIHEALTNYAESLFIEYHYGKEAALAYIYGNRQGILNDEPLQGPMGVNKRGSGDMYLKGGVFFNMLRAIISDDVKWRCILRGINQEFYHKTVDYTAIENYFSVGSGVNLSNVFAQYIQHATIPTLELKIVKGRVHSRWIADVAGFDMPIRIRNKDGEYKMIKPGSCFTETGLRSNDLTDIEVDTLNYYIHVQRKQ